MQKKRSTFLFYVGDAKTKDLELLVADLQNKLIDAERTAKLERERSKHYLEVIQQLSRIMGQSSKESPMTIDREQDAEELVEEIDSLKEHIDRLECRLEHTTKDLQTAKHQLSAALKSERSIKRGLGLREDADQDEVNSKIAEIKTGSIELQKYREEMQHVREMKDVYNEKIRKLTLNMSRLESEKRTKDMEIERLLRNKDDRLVLKQAKSLLKFRPNCAVVKTEELALPRINIGSRLPSSKTNSRDGRNISARDTKKLSVEQLNNISAKAEAKYCVLCRKEYYVRDVCRFHMASPKDGAYACCGAKSYGAAGSSGCRTIASHLYADAIGCEIVFYDQRGRQLNFKEIDIKESNFTERL